MMKKAGRKGSHLPFSLIMQRYAAAHASLHQQHDRNFLKHFSKGCVAIAAGQCVSNVRISHTDTSSSEMNQQGSAAAGIQAARAMMSA